MLKSRFFLVLSIFFFCVLPVPQRLSAQTGIEPQTPAWGQPTLDTEKLFSPSVGQKFYEIAYELANAPDTGGSEAEQAIIFLTATTNLDSRANYVLPDMIKLASRFPSAASILPALMPLPAQAAAATQSPGKTADDPARILYNLIRQYVNESADLEVAEQAIRYLLEQLDSREQREKLLEDLLTNLQGKNARLESQLHTLLGLLMTEKADFQTAQAHLMQAYNSDKYNRLAFEKLAELAPEQFEPAAYLEYLRLKLAENPLDMEAALAFAQYARSLELYETAADAYEYCAKLFAYLYPSQPLPAHIYLPWMISTYNTQRNQHKCLQIADRLRQSGRFDLVAEAIAARAAAKLGDTEQANWILRTAEDKALELLDYKQAANYQQLAWFYCFASPDADKAIDWANKAYSIEPTSPTAAALLAYSLVMNGQADWARPIIDAYEHNQLAELTLAQILLTDGKKDSAIETLKSAIAKEPATLEAEHAKEILTRHGAEYIPPVDHDLTLIPLRNSFGQQLVPAFTPPEKIISVQLNVRGSKFSYGSKFDGSVAITNNSSGPLVISENGLFTGNIRIDADVKGDINKKIPKLVSLKIKPAQPVEPGRSIFIPVRLLTAQLGHLLLTYPQASVDIEFTAYLDPVTAEGANIVNRLTTIKPARVTVSRPGIELTGRFLRNRFSSLTNGRQGQKIRAAQLFTGLLAEQKAMANREPLYKFMYADWMPRLLKSGLLHNLNDDDWVTNVQTMAAMSSLTLDYELTNALAEKLNDTHWPVRLMAVALLAKSQGDSFAKVLDWTARYDPNTLVRNMAVALGAARPRQQNRHQPNANKTGKTHL